MAHKNLCPRSPEKKSHFANTRTPVAAKPAHIAMGSGNASVSEGRVALAKGSYRSAVKNSIQKRENPTDMLTSAAELPRSPCS